jgi:hypothetical protein
MTTDDNEAFEAIAQQVQAETAFETYVESTGQMMRMLEVVVDMASRVSMSAKLYADAAGATDVSNQMYRDVFMNVWDRTLTSMFEGTQQHDALRTILSILDQRGDDHE